jgi:putative MATE family efflux protein
MTARQRQNEATALITSGRVWSAVWYLAWPSAITTLMQASYVIINRIFLAHLPNAQPSLAAAGVGGAALMLQFALTIGLSAGTSALVSRFLGADQIEDAEQAARQSLILSVIAGAATGVPFALCARYVVIVIGTTRSVLPLATDYTAIISWSSFAMFVTVIAIAILRSQGDVRSPLYSGIAVIGLNVLFDWLLIFGFWRVPSMGIRGAALATVISRLAGMILALAFVHRSALAGSLKRWHADVEWFARILAIGWPASVQNLINTGASLMFLHVLSMLATQQATTAQAAYAAAIAIEALAFQPGIAYSIAATPLVGQNLGAAKPERAAHSAWVATGQAAAVMAAVGGLFLAIPQLLATPFARDVTLVPVIVAYLRINSFSEPFLALNMVLRGALQGAGDTRVPAVVTFASMWLVRIPLAWLFAIRLHMGANGAWWAMSLTCCLAGVLMALWFRFGTWRQIRV